MKQSRREELHSSGRAAFGAPLRHHSGRTLAAASPLKRRLSITDSLGGVTARIANPDYQSTIAYTWDGANRLSKIVDSVAGTITRSYDERFDAPKQEVTPEGTVEYRYHGNGLRRSMTPSGGTQIGYAYDDANRLTGIGQAAGTGNAQPAAPQNVGLGYDEADRRTSLVLPNGIRIAYTWDDANQLTGIGYRTDTGTVIGDLSYGYDAAGQRIRQGGSLAAQDLPATEAGASYDANNRLTDWNGQSIAYDANGNLTADGVSRYTWNSRNQLVAITGATSASFAYDGLGRRRGRSVNGTAMQYLYDGLNAIQEQTGGAASANLLSGLGLDEWYGRTEAGASLAYVPDALGSVLALADANQSLATRYTYEPYGTTTASGATSANSLAYTGRENDGTGLYYYRARYYHPGIGRFVSEDPIGLRGGFNLSTYVNNAPTMYTDPMGLQIAIPIPSIPPGGGNSGSVWDDVGKSSNSVWDDLGFSSGSKGSGGGRPDKDCEEKCRSEYDLDNALCGVARAFWGGAGAVLCYSRANRNYSECLRGCCSK